MRRIALAAALLVVAHTAVASAQATAQARKGFGISFGFGGGSAGATCDGCTSDRSNGMSGYLRIGGHIRPNLLLAGETNGWVHSEDGVDETLGFFSAVAQWYPTPTNGFYLKGGLGISTYSASDGVDDATSSAAAINLGLGYDFRVGTNFSLTPFANYLHATEGEMKINSTNTGFNLSANLLQIGLGFTWH